MQVNQVMINNFVGVSPNDSIEHARQLMQEGSYSVLPVCDNAKLVGMIFKSDIKQDGNSDSLDSLIVNVNQVMTSNLKYVYEDDSTDLARGYMSEFKLQEIPVFNRHQKMIGILKLEDIKLAEENSKIISSTAAS